MAPVAVHVRRRVATLGCLLGVALALAACSDSEPAETDEDAGKPDAGFVSIDITVEEVFGGAVEAAEICAYEAKPENCVVTDANGRAELAAPEDSEFGLTVEKADFAKELLPTRTGTATLELSIVALPDSVYKAALESAGIEQDPELGALLTFQEEGGGSARLEPKSGDGPYYFGALGVIDPNATSVPIGGGVLFANIDPDEYELIFEHPDGDCAFPEKAWEGSGVGRTRFAAVADWGTGTWPPVCPAARGM